MSYHPTTDNTRRSRLCVHCKRERERTREEGEAKCDARIVHIHHTRTAFFLDLPPGVEPFFFLDLPPFRANGSAATATGAAVPRALRLSVAARSRPVTPGTVGGRFSGHGFGCFCVVPLPAASWASHGAFLFSRSVGLRYEVKKSPRFVAAEDEATPSTPLLSCGDEASASLLKSREPPVIIGDGESPARIRSWVSTSAGRLAGDDA